MILLLLEEGHELGRTHEAAHMGGTNPIAGCHVRLLHSGWMPIEGMTRPHRASSLLIFASSAAGPSPTASIPCCLSSATTSGFFTVAAIAALSLSTIGLGVPAGANRPS